MRLSEGKMSGPTFVALLLNAASICIHQVEGVAIKKYNAKHNDGGYIFIGLVSLVAMLFFIVTDTNGVNITTDMLPYGIASGIFYASASIMTFAAYACGSFVLTNLFLSYALLFSVVYGLVFLNDPATILTYVGLGVMLVSVFLVRGEGKSGAEKVKVSWKWVVCVVVSMIGSGMFGVLKKLQQVKFERACDNEFMVVTLGFSVLAMLVMAIIKDGKRIQSVIRHGAPYAGVAGVANGATNLLGLLLNTLIPISIAAPTASGVKIIVSFLLASLVFKEKLSKRQIAGVVLGTAALILLNLDI